jgi:hypothetical protein
MFKIGGFVHQRAPAQSLVRHARSAGVLHETQRSKLVPHLLITVRLRQPSCWMMSMNSSGL